MQTQRSLSIRLLVWAAEIVLALLTLALIVCMWLPIENFRDWLTLHFHF